MIRLSTLAKIFKMALLSLFKSNTKNEIKPADSPTQTSIDAEKGVNVSEKSDDEEQLSSDAQAGVRAVEAAATVWTKAHLIGAYVM